MNNKTLTFSFRKKVQHLLDLVGLRAKVSWPMWRSFFGAFIFISSILMTFTLITGCAEGEKEEGSEKESEEDEERSEVKDRIKLHEESLRSLHLTFGKAELKDLSPSLKVPAEVIAVPDQKATLGSRVAGRILKVLVNIGDVVSAGDALILLESSEVGEARAELMAAFARAEVAEQKHARLQALLKDRISSKRNVEAAAGELRVANADLQAARTKLRTYGVPAAAKNAAQVVVTSPIAGTVTKRQAFIGKMAEPKDMLVEVVNLDSLWVMAKVYEKEMRLIEIGQPVQVEVRAFPGEVFQSKVQQIGAIIDEKTRSAEIRIELKNEKHRLRPGMYATARIAAMHAHAQKPMLAIPWAAIQNIDGHPSVFVRIKKTLFELRRVHTGERAGDLVEVLNGLSAGDDVVAAGSFLLKGELLKSSLGEDE